MITNKQHIKNLKGLIKDMQESQTMPQEWKEALTQHYKQELKKALKC